MNLLKLVLKPQMKKLFQFPEIHECTFTADFLKDTLDLKGKGITVFNNYEPIERKGKTLKLSDNQEQINLFVPKVKETLNPKEIHLIVYHIDYINECTKVDVFYIDQNGQKCKNDKLGTKF